MGRKRSLFDLCLLTDSRGMTGAADSRAPLNSPSTAYKDYKTHCLTLAWSVLMHAQRAESVNSFANEKMKAFRSYHQFRSTSEDPRLELGEVRLSPQVFES